MHRFRQGEGLQDADPVDQRCARGGSQHLSGDRLPAGEGGGAPFLRKGSRRADLGSRSVKRREALALMAAAATGVQVGAAMVATRFVVHDIGPASLAFLRYAIAVLCLVPPVLMSVRVRFAMRDLLVVMALGIVQFGVLIALLNLGLQFISSTRAALLFSTFPLMTMVIAAFLGLERLTGAKTAGVLLTIVGVAVALGEGLITSNGTGDTIGALLVLAAALCGAVSSVLYRPYLARYPTLPVGASAMLASVVFLAGPAGLE